MKRFGTVVTFKPGVTKEEAVNAIKKLAEAGVVVEWPTVREFDDKYGGPVWYIP